MNGKNRPAKSIRRSGIRIMASLVALLGSFACVLFLAVLNGSLGQLCAVGVTLSGAVGVARVLGEPIPLSYAQIAALIVGCGLLRGRRLCAVRPGGAVPHERGGDEAFLPRLSYSGG